MKLAEPCRDLVLVTTGAVITRLISVSWGFWETNDGVDYLIIAKNVAFHHIFSIDTNTNILAPTAHRPPLYPALIAALWWRAGAPIYPMLVIQALLGAATVALVYLIARDRFNRTVGLIASIGMVLAPMTCHYTRAILTETLFTFLITLGLFFWGRERFFGAGLILGLATLTRPALLLFLIALPLLALVPAWKACRRAYTLVLIAALAVSSVWIVRNAVVFGRFVPVAASGWGTNLLCGTFDTDLIGRVWTGTEWAPLNIEGNPLLKVDGTLNEGERDSVRMRRALKRIIDSPSYWILVRAKQYPKLIVDNGAYMLGSYNLPLVEALHGFHPLVLFVKLVFIIGNLFAFMLASYGAFIERARFVSLSHIVLFPIFLLLVHIPVWIEPRYLLPAEPMIAVLAAIGVLALHGRLRSAKAKTSITKRTAARRCSLSKLIMRMRTSFV